MMYLFLWAASSQGGYQVILIPRISITPEYVDNLFSSHDNEAYDYITVISPGITAQITEKTRGATLSYDLGYSCYDSFPQFNTLRHNAQFSGWVEFSKHTRLDFQNAFILTEESVTKIEESPDETETPLAEPEKHVAEKETVRKSLEHHYTYDAIIAFTHQFGESDALSMKYAYSILENEDPTIEDKISHTPSVDVTYWFIPRQLSMEGGVSYTRDEFSDTYESPGYWEESINPILGLNYWFIPDRFGVQTGVSYTTGEYSNRSDGLNHWYKSTNPSVSLTYRPKFYQLELEAGLSCKRGRFSDPSDDFDNWSGNVGVSKQFTKKLGGFVKYSHSVMDFKGNGENYTIHDPSVGITYTPDEGVPVSLSIGYFFRNRQINENESAISLNGDIGKTWTISRYGSVSFKTSSGYDEDYLGAEKMGFGIYYDAGFTGKYVFSKELSGDVYGSYRRDKYDDLETTRDDETRELGSGLVFQKKWFTVRVDYSYRTVNSTLSENDYEENRIRWQVSLAPFRPIRIFQ